jgi:FixJ family two-component response regulator
MSEGSEHIALIDDDASMRRSLGNLLASLGFRVGSYASAEEFLAERPPGIDCLVLDLKLPGISGLELLDRLRESEPGLRVILLTAHGDAETRRRALGLGAVAFLSKPFRAEDLVAAVRRRHDNEP